MGSPEAEIVFSLKQHLQGGGLPGVSLTATWCPALISRGTKSLVCTPYPVDTQGALLHHKILIAGTPFLTG
jgi:hypothetical protein